MGQYSAEQVLYFVDRRVARQDFSLTIETSSSAKHRWSICFLYYLHHQDKRFLLTLVHKSLPFSSVVDELLRRKR